MNARVHESLSKANRQSSLQKLRKEMKFWNFGTRTAFHFGVAGDNIKTYNDEKGNLGIA